MLIQSLFLYSPNIYPFSPECQSKLYFPISRVFWYCHMPKCWSMKRGNHGSPCPGLTGLVIFPLPSAIHY